MDEKEVTIDKLTLFCNLFYSIIAVSVFITVKNQMFGLDNLKKPDHKEHMRVGLLKLQKNLAQSDKVFHGFSHQNYSNKRAWTLRAV